MSLTALLIHTFQTFLIFSKPHQYSHCRIPNTVSIKRKKENTRWFCAKTTRTSDHRHELEKLEQVSDKYIEFSKFYNTLNLIKSIWEFIYLIQEDHGNVKREFYFFFCMWEFEFCRRNSILRLPEETRHLETFFFGQKLKKVLLSIWESFFLYISSFYWDFKNNTSKTHSLFLLRSTKSYGLFAALNWLQWCHHYHHQHLI